MLSAMSAHSVTGLDHVYLSVSDLARSEAFYDPVMRALGFRKGDKPIAGERHLHYFCPALQITLRPARNPRVAHDPYAPGLHHLCLQVATNEAVDEAHRALTALGVTATAPARYPEYNPDYYATFFTDPDGLRLELVARTPYREALAREWDEYRHFLNPRAALEGERTGVFHIAERAAWETCARLAEYRTPSLESEGFIHCSTRAQVLETASRYYRGRTDLLLLRLDAVRLAPELRYEPPAPPRPDAGYALFPHLYGPLPTEAVLAVHAIEPGPDGSFSWPEGA